VKNPQASKREPASFLAIIERLEHTHGHRLHGEKRANALRAFHASPEGFARIALAAEERANRSPLGLFRTMIDAGEHLLSPAENERLADRPVSPAFVCPDCTGLSFPSEARLIEHRENVHGEWSQSSEAAAA